MYRHYECKNAYEKQERMQNKNIKIKQEDLPRTTWRSWRTLWMHEFSKKKMRKEFLEKMQLTPNLKIDSRLKQETQNIFDFYDFMIFLYFLLFFSKKTYRKRN